MELRQINTATAVDLHPSGYKGEVTHLLKPVEAMTNGLEGLLDDPESGVERVWQNFANCVGVEPDLFFSVDANDIQEAKGVCQTCMAKDACSAFAFTRFIVEGVWGERYMGDEANLKVAKLRTSRLGLARAAGVPSDTTS